MARPHGVAHLCVHEGRSPDEVARFSSRAEELGMSVSERVPLLQRDFLDDSPAPGTGDRAAVPMCMHDYTNEAGLVRLKLCWRMTGCTE